MLSKKRILFLTDFSPNENGYAGPQTAYNFIKLFVENECLLLINASYHKEIIPNQEWIKNKDYVLFNYIFHYRINSRLNKILSFIGSVINPRFFYFRRTLIKRLKMFNPDSIICITNSAYIYKAASVLKMKIPNVKLFFYIMDDYKHYEKPYLQKSIDKILSKSSGWFSISAPMVNLFHEKYPSLTHKPSMIIQNPVNLSGFKRKQNKNSPGKVTLVYAGSVYSNHKDSLLNVIDAINNTNCCIELSIYTKSEFRVYFQNRESEKVVYKGNLAYKQLLAALSEYDYGLVVESFLPQFSNFAMSSIQTKINDYIFTGCLPVVLGPPYGACVNQIDKNKIGYKISENTDNAICNFFNSLRNDENYITYVGQAQTYLVNTLRDSYMAAAKFIS